MKKDLVPEKLVEVVRGNLVESSHNGHVAITDNKGNLKAYWGNPNHVIYPRSSCKIIQALPLLESGAADHYFLESKHLALACASHSGGNVHLEVARDWLLKLGIKKDHLLCGAHLPEDVDEAKFLAEKGLKPSQLHNNCSGKHLGFLTISKHIELDEPKKINYINIKHPVQVMVKKVFEEMTNFNNSNYALDGCSAPNFACSVKALATAMANFAQPNEFEDKRKIAIKRLKEAVLQNPYLIAGEDRLCTKLMKKSAGRFIVKVGAEGVYSAILLEEGLGLAIKISDGARRAAECLIVALFVRLGLLNKNDREIQSLLNAPIINWSNYKTGFLKASNKIWEEGKILKI